MANVESFRGNVYAEDLIVYGSFSAPGLIATADLADSSVTTVKLAANAATGAKVPENALGSIEAVAVDLDLDDTSPKELLAADANNDRIVLVRAVATEAAAGTPDLDVGSETTDPNGIVDDFQAGVWAVGDRWEGIINLPAGEALDATITVPGTAGSFDVYIRDITAIVQTGQIADDAVIGAKIPENALGSIEGAAVPLAHDDTSPFELLAADASNDRILLVRGVATEAAGGGPDVDIGSESTDPNGIVDDFEAGAWVVGDRFLNIITLPATEALDATITAAGTAGEIDVYITDITPLVQTAQIANDAVTTVKINANAATGAKIPENALGSIEGAAVPLAHDDTSPFELLAADASNDRILLVRGVATEEAAGTPDIDIGSESTDPNGIVDDFEAGAWVVGDRFLNIITLPATEALDATITAAGTAGEIDVYITDITPLVQTAQIANDAVTTVKMTATIPLTLSVSATLANRGGVNSDGCLIGTLTHSPINYAFADDGGAFTDETTEANSAGANDMTLLPATETTDDIYYFGQDGVFSGIILHMGTQGVVSGSGAASILWEYWDGANWVTLETSTFADDSVGFTAGTSTYAITFEPPSDWAATDINSQSAFWVRATCAVADYTTTPIGTQCWILEHATGEGIYSPLAGTVSAVQMNATTNSATNNDSVFLLINVTQGTFDKFTWTGGDNVLRDATISLAVAVGDELVIQMIQEDGSTEYADSTFILEITL